MSLVNAEDFGVNANAPDNRAALQRAIDDCVDTRRVLRLPAMYRIRAPLLLPNIGEGRELVIEGDCEFSCGIQAENDTFPIFTNSSGTAPQDLARLTLRKLKLRDGRHAIRFVRSGTAVQSLLNCESIRFETQGTGAIHCDQWFLVNNFVNCVFYYCVNGIYSGKHANLLNVHYCRFEGLDGYSLFLDASRGERGCESAHIVGCRIEARNTPGIRDGAVFRLRNARLFTVEHCYIENTFKRILEETGSNNSTAFLRNWFSGQENDVPPNGWKSEEFMSDGVVIFDTNQFLQTSRGAARMDVRGTNSGLNR